MSVCITFNDCCSTVYENAYPVMKRHEVLGTFFICGKYVGQPFDAACICNKRCRTAISVEQCHELFRADWEFGSHTYSHVDMGTCDSETRHHEILNNNLWLHSNGFPTPRGITYPYGSINHQALEMASSFFAYGRLADVTSKYEGSERMQVPAMPLNAKTTLADAVKYGIEKGREGLAVFAGHRIAAGTPDTFTWNITDFNGLLDALKQAGLKFMTMEEATCRI
jgi:peptidoglycan/xylan/chitin deacetylase (PgdA/CDA1 family)